MTEVKFNTEDWRNYYNAEIDEEYVKDLFKEEDHSRVTSANFYGETLDVRLESDFSGFVYPPNYDSETGEEIESQDGVEIEATYFCEIYYKIGDLGSRIEDFNESLNNAIKNGESKFEIKVPIVVDEIYDIQLEDVEIYDEEADEDGVRETVFADVANRLDNIASNSRLEISSRRSIQSPTDKEIKFICTIPAE